MILRLLHILHMKFVLSRGNYITARRGHYKRGHLEEDILVPVLMHARVLATVLPHIHLLIRRQSKADYTQGEILH